MNLSQLNSEIEHEVSQRQGEIIGSAFDALKVHHAKKAQFSGCNCSYCLALRNYVGVKIRIHRLTRRYDLTGHDKFFGNTHWAVDQVMDYSAALPELRRKKNERKHDL